MLLLGINLGEAKPDGSTVNKLLTAVSVNPGQHDPGGQFVTSFRIYQQSDPLLQSNQATGHCTAKCGEISPSENRASLISKDKLVLGSHTATTKQAKELARSGLANDPSWQLVCLYCIPPLPAR